MRKALLASTILAPSLAIGSVAVAQPAVITPEHGTIIDAGGNTYQITADGSILENGDIWVAGGGGTAALTIEHGTVYGLDATGKGWFAFSSGSQTWGSVPASGAGAAALTAPAANAASAPAAPVQSAATCAPITGGVATGGFTVSNGQFIAPDGSVFIAKGMDVYDSAMGSADQILAMFPGINFVRLNVYSQQSPSAYQAFISQMTGAGVVVMVDWHVGAGGGVQAPTGAALAAETNWFASMASYYKTNTAVWFNTLNEPANNQQTYAEQTAVYQAIRGAGSNAIVLLEWAGQSDGSYASGMTNIGIDAHYYGWQSHYSTDQGAVSATLQSSVSSVQQAFGNVPVLIGEYGVSTDGNSPDPNGDQVVTAVTSSGLGSAAWNWDSQAGSDNLTINGAMTPYGQMVAGYIALVKGAAASVWAAVCPTASTVTAPAAQTASDLASSTAPASSTTTAATAAPDPAAAALDTQAAQAVAAATAAAQAAQAAIARERPVPAASQ